MGTFRAVKVVYRKRFADEHPYEREFHGIRSFEPISRSHPGFVPILQVGRRERDGYFYYVMELADDLADDAGGRLDIRPETYRPYTLDTHARRGGRLPFSECLRMGTMLAGALEELHRQGRVHRDIKPSNIIFIQGTPRLADIGLVTETNEAQSFVGTEGFIPPEGPGSESADIFGLGKVLYEISTGNDRMQFPAMPRTADVDPEFHQFLELNEIILKACALEPSQRYDTARKMHAELVALENGHSIVELHRLERRLSQLKHAGVVVAAFAAVGLIVGWLVFQHIQLKNRERQFEIARYLSLGEEYLHHKDSLRALASFADAYALMPDNAENRAEERLRFHALLGSAPALIASAMLDRDLVGVEWSPDGRQVLAWANGGGVFVWEPETRPSCRALLREGCGGAAQWPTDSQWVAVIDNSTQQLRIQDVMDGGLRGEFDLSNPATCCVWSRDGCLLAVAENDPSPPHRIALWRNIAGPDEVPVLRKVTDFPAHAGTIANLAFSPDGKFLASASHDRTARVWEVETGQPVGSPLRHTSWVYDVTFSPDGKSLCTGSFDRTARVWKTGTAEQILPPLKHEGAVTSVDFSPDGRFILTSSYHRELRLWRADAGDLEVVLAHPQALRDAAFSPDGHRLVSVGTEGDIQVWDRAKAMLPLPIPVTASSPNHRFFLLVTNRNTTNWQVWAGRNPRNPRNFGPVDFTAQKVIDQGVSDSGQFALLVQPSQSAPNHRNLLLSGFPPNLQLHHISLPPLRPDGAGFLTENGKCVVYADPHSCALFDTQSRKWTPPIQEAEATLTPRPGISPNRDLVAMFGTGFLAVYRVADGERLFRWSPDLPIRGVRFSPDGRRLVVAFLSVRVFEPCPAWVIDTETGELVHPPMMHPDGVLDAIIDSDNQLLVTLAENGEVRLWDLARPEAEPAVFPHPYRIHAADFLPRRNYLLVGGRQGVKIYDFQQKTSLTPFIPHVWDVTAVSFLGSDRFFFQNGHGQFFLVELHSESDPKTPISAYHQGIRAMIGKVESPSSAIPNAPPILSKKQTPQSPASHPRNLLLWYDFQLQESYNEQNWTAALWHLDQLAAKFPEYDPLGTKRQFILRRLNGQP